tara:strand:+ start:767 stop:1168 length:402 start_codon:yes stop_codon:yes gene_type:complete
MKKTLLLAAALACSGAVAQEKEIWACQQIEGTMLFWENSSWRQTGIIPDNILITINADNTGSAKRSSEDYSNNLTCTSPRVGSHYSCLDSALLTHYLFSPDEGKLGISSLYGAIMTSAERDTVSAEIFNCTKF